MKGAKGEQCFAHGHLFRLAQIRTDSQTSFVTSPFLGEVLSSPVAKFDAARLAGLIPLECEMAGMHKRYYGSQPMVIA